MARKLLSPEQSPAAETPATSPPWAPEDWIANSIGFRWMTIGLQVWTAWLEQCGIALNQQDADSSRAEDRRRAGLPWLPQFESTVVQLRRRSDQPGAEAEKLSLRIQVPPLPWENGGGRVIAFDSLRPRKVEAPIKDSPTKH